MSWATKELIEDRIRRYLKPPRGYRKYEAKASLVYLLATLPGRRYRHGRRLYWVDGRRDLRIKELTPLDLTKPHSPQTTRGRYARVMQCGEV